MCWGAYLRHYCHLDFDETKNISSTNNFFKNCESLEKRDTEIQVKTWEIQKLWVIFSVNAQVKCNQQHMQLSSTSLFASFVRQVWRWSLFIKTSLTPTSLSSNFTLSLFSTYFHTVLHRIICEMNLEKLNGCFFYRWLQEK